MLLLLLPESRFSLEQFLLILDPFSVKTITILILKCTIHTTEKDSQDMCTKSEELPYIFSESHAYEKL